MRLKEIPENKQFDEERLEMTEKILRFLDTAHGIVGLDGKRAEEVLQDATARRELIGKLDYKQYEMLLCGINGILRGRPQSEWNMDGEQVAMWGTSDEYPSYDFPEFADKPKLLSLALSAAQRMAAEGRSLEDIGIVLSTNITSVHPFNDGNGRTSRFILEIAVKGFSQETKSSLEFVLKSEDLSATTSGARFEPFVRQVLLTELGILMSPADLALTVVNEYGAVDKWLRGSLDSYLHSSGNGELSQESWSSLKHILLYSPRHGIPALRAYFKDRVADGRLDKMLALMTNGDVTAITALWKDIKRRNVELIIDCIEHPDKEEYKDATGRSILDIYRMKNKELLEHTDSRG